MKWTPGGTSSDIEDRRGEDPGLGGGGGFGGGGPSFRIPPGVHLGGGTLVLLLLLYLGRGFLSGGGGAPVASQPQQRTPSTSQDRLVQFVSFVLDDAQATWGQKLGSKYHHAKLVLFTEATQSGCGEASAATGPFYCPADEKVYIDLAFYKELVDRFGAPGEFAQAYVIAHELGHHVQKLLGIEAQMRRAQERNPSEANHLSVKLELQADCFAGVWAASTQQRGLLEPGDVDSALGAAAAVGDDRLQKQAGVRVNAETWTHGSAEQRKLWLKRGMDQGSIDACDTFAAN
jgi:predicted metalloprotease